MVQPFISTLISGGYLTDRIPHVVESGISGGWNWEKRSDGRAEIWVYSAASAQITDEWGAFYTNNSNPIVWTIPDIFSEIPQDIQVTSATSWFFPSKAVMTDKRTLNVEIIGPASGNRTVYFNVKIVGKWK